MTIEEAIERSGTKNILAKGSTKKAQSLIRENEEVLYAINTNVSVVDNKKTVINNTKGMFSLKNSLNGVIVITNSRIIFCSSIIGNTNIKQIQIKNITSIDESINRLTKMGQLRIQGITETFLINIYKSKISNELKEVIYKAQDIQKQASNTTANINISSADEILKFKQLLNEGIITEKEFEKKKQELLK
ncbi:MAG: hypothetical protein HFJ34_04765 [Clostridia bacterium]|nr:hypothetical protein [Clostridia bacterium]